MKVSNKGLSVIEVLISIGLITVTAVALLSVSSTLTKVDLNTRGRWSCANHVRSILDRLQSIGPVTGATNFWPKNTAPGTYSPLATGPTAGKSEVGIAQSDRWKGGVKYDITNPPIPPASPGGNLTQLRNAHLLQGNMNSLLAIYNSNVNRFCNTAGGATYNSPILFPVGEQDNLRGITTKIRIQAFDLRAPTTLSCPNDLIIAPKGLNDPAQAIVRHYITHNDEHTGVTHTSDMGLLVTLTTSYTNENNNTQSCTAQQRFQYPGDFRAPFRPVFIRIYNTTAGDAGGAHQPPCNPSNVIVMNVGYNVNLPPPLPPMEPGVQLLCADASVLYDPNNDGAGGRMAKCYDEAGTTDLNMPQPRPTFNVNPNHPLPSGQPVQAYPLNPVPPPSLGNGPGTLSNPNLPIGPTHGTGHLGNHWLTYVPCNQVTLCGTPPSYVSISSNTDGDKFRYDFTYRDVTPNCLLTLRVIAIDAAGNIGVSDPNFNNSAWTWPDPPPTGVPPYILPRPALTTHFPAPPSTVYDPTHHQFCGGYYNGGQQNSLCPPNTNYRKFHPHIVRSKCGGYYCGTRPSDPYGYYTCSSTCP